MNAPGSGTNRGATMLALLLVPKLCLGTQVTKLCFASRD